MHTPRKCGVGSERRHLVHNLRERFGFRVSEVEFRVSDFGFRFQGFGGWVWPCSQVHGLCSSRHARSPVHICPFVSENVHTSGRFREATHLVDHLRENFGVRVLGVGFRASDFGLRVSISWFRGWVWPRCRVHGLCSSRHAGSPVQIRQLV